MTQFRGIFAAMVTPFSADGEQVDEAALGDLVDWLIGEGVHGLIPLGSTGEFATLTGEERRRVAEVTVEQAARRVPVVVQTAAVSTRETVALSRHAAEIGADGVMIVPPYYEPISEEEVYAHYAAVAEAVKLPIVLYNIPVACGFDMKPSFVARLAEIPTVQYIKDSTGDARRVQELIQVCGDRIGVFNGADTLSLLGLVAGACGMIWGAANVTPRACVELYDLVARQRDLARAQALWHKMQPLQYFLENEGYVASVKAGAAMVGMEVGPPRRPILPLSDARVAELRRLLEPLGVLQQTAR